MSHLQNTETHIQLPKLKELGTDLIRLNTFQKVWTLVKPLIFSLGYFVLFNLEYYVMSFICVVLLQFNTYVSSSHDLVHNSLRIPKKWNELFLSILELLSLRSGHAFKTAHLNHHRCFPNKHDFEGRSIYKSFWGALLSGPFYIISIYFWSTGNSQKKDKPWIIMEGLIIVLYFLASIMLIKDYPVLFYYFVILYITSWVYPIFTVFIPHRLNFEHPIFQTIKFRGPWIGFLFAQHNYHLEHHLYPSIPHQNWQKLAERLEPFLKHKNIKEINF